MSTEQQSDAAKREPVRIFLADGHSLMREGLKSIIRAQDDLTVCGEHDRLDGLVEAVMAEQPDLFVLDIGFADGCGMEAIEELCRRRCAFPMLVVSTRTEDDIAERVIRAGASGFVMKEEATRLVIPGIRAALAGDVYLSTEMQQRLLRKMRGSDVEPEDPTGCLTSREKEVLEFIGIGLSSREIAERLSLSASTIDVHKANIRGKLQLESAPELLRFAIQYVSG